MRRRGMFLCLAAVLVACAAGLAAQNPVKTLQRVNDKLPSAVQAPPAAAVQPAPASPASAAPAAGAVVPGELAPEDNLLVEGESLYRHQADRDPFTPLVRSGQRGPEVKVRPGSTGLARFTVEACVLEVVIKTPQGTVAWFQGPDNKAYKAAVGERFADGVVLDISYGSGEVTVQQELNDPTAIKPFRNLVLRIRNLEGEGQ
jgi:hypothetical protein